MASISEVESSADKGFISLQELVKGPMITIPQDYIRVHQEPVSHQPTFLPIIDLKKLLSTDHHVSVSEIQNLHITCKDWGFFQLVNHGTSSSLVEKVNYEIEEYFKLPFEEKAKYKSRPGDYEGFGSVVRGDGKHDWADRFFVVTNPIHSRKPYLFPELPSSLRNILESYLEKVQNLGMKLLGFMAEGLKVDKGEMEELFENGIQSMRMTYYPPCPEPEKVMGITPHSDATGITILHQVNGVDGLEIKKNGVWFPVCFLPDSLVINVGDILQMLSNGVYSSIEHRVRINNRKERMSLAFFMNPKFEAEIGPIKSLINRQQKPPLFKRLKMEQYLQDFYSHKLNGKSFLLQMKIQTADDDEPSKET